MDANKIIDDLGGTSKVAELCKVTTGAVSQWRENGIPEARMMFLMLARPDVFSREKKAKDRRKPSSPLPLGKHRRSTDCAADHTRPDRKIS